MRTRVTRPGIPFGLDSAHSSAPSIVRRGSGELVMVYRQGTDHYVSRDGVIKITRSTDDGHTWSAPATVLTLQPSFDLQGAGISESRDGTTLWLVYFKATTSLGAAGVFVRSSTDGGTTWSGETRVDGNLPYAATTDVIVELDDGTLVNTYYGRSGAETWDSVWIAKSTDGGSTWSSTRLKNGQAVSAHFQEPVLAMNGHTGVIGYRHGTVASVGTMLTTNDTATFTSGTAVFAGTGKPHVFWADGDRVACLYRQLTSGNMMIRFSDDNGVNWYPEVIASPNLHKDGWTLYSSHCAMADGLTLIAYAMEYTSPDATPGTSRLFFAYAGPAGQPTPYGVLVNDQQADDDLLFTTTFDQPNGTLADPWQAVILGGAATTAQVIDGTACPTVLNQTPGTILRVALAHVSDLDIEAEIYNQAGAGSAAGIVFRMVTSGTFLVYVAEDVNLRLYKYANGAAAQLAVLPLSSIGTGLTHQYNAWNRMRVVARGNYISCFYNDWPVLAHQLSTNDQLTYGAGFYHGVKLLPQSGSVQNHRVRSWSARGTGKYV